MPPPNDFIGNAIIITAPSTTAVSTVGALLGGSGNPIDDDSPYPDVWYRIEPANDVLLGISLSKTGSAGIPEVDIYTLVGSDPPTSWADIDAPFDFCGDGTDTPTGWFSGLSHQYFKLQGDSIYYLDCTDYNYTDEVEFNMVFTTAEPVANDDLVDAIIINQVGSNVLRVTNVLASTEFDEFSNFDGSPSVWYRIEAPDNGHISLSILDTSGYRVEAEYRHLLEIYGPIATDPPTITSLASEPFIGQVRDTGPHSNHPPYDDTGGWEPWLREWLCSTGDVFYVRVTNASQFGDPIEGSFTMRVTLREWTTFDAVDGINGGSSTTSIVDTDWVKDTQYRKIDPTGATWKGTLDYTKTFQVEPGLSGKYEVQVFGRFKSPTSQTGQEINCIMRVNGVPVRIGDPLFDSINDSPEWWSLTQEYMLLGSGGYGFNITPGLAVNCEGGPRYIQLSVGDVVSFDIGNNRYHQGFGPIIAPDRTFEVQKVRFSPASTYDPLPSWRTSLADFESFEFYSYSNFMACSRGSKLYMFQDAFYYTSALPATGDVPFLNVIEYELVDGRMEAVNGDLPIDGSNPPADLALVRTDTSGYILMKDICVLDNGDIYVLWSETASSGTPGSDFYLVLKKWDGSSWTLVSDDISGHGAPTNDHVFNTPSMDTDGTDIWIIWGENRTASDYSGAPGYWWRCMKYDVGGNTLTELGSGQTAYPSAPAGSAVGNFDKRMRVRVSPGHVPYVLFEDYDSSVSNDTLMFLWRWDGAVWEDMELPYPNPIPDPIGSYNASTFAPGNGNYESATEDVFIPHDIVFCHHDGPSETPAILHNYWWNGVGAVSGSGQLGDIGTWFYAECDGIGDWHNEMLIIEGGQPEQAPTSIVYGNEYPQRFSHSSSDFDGNSWIPWGGGWCQGMKLVIYKGRPTFINSLGYFGSGTDCIYVSQINAAGDSWDLLGTRFPTDLYTSDVSGFAWGDTGEPGCLIGDTIVCYWEDYSANAFTSYYMAVFAPSGNLVPMHWHHGSKPNKIILRS